MDLTKEDWQDWKATPCTRAMCELVQEAINQYRERPIVGKDADETLKNAYERDAWIEGISEILNMIDEEIPDES